MPDVHWNSSYLVGHPEMDAQHEELVSIMQELFQSQQAINSTADTVSILDRLIAHTIEHNACEDRLMLEHGYPASAAHMHEHEALLQQINAMREEQFNQEPGLSSASMLFLKQWLFNHVLNSDRALAAFIANPAAQAP